MQYHVVLLSRGHLTLCPVVIRHIILISVTCVFIDHQANCPATEGSVATKVWKGRTGRRLNIIVATWSRGVSAWWQYSWGCTNAVLILEEASNVIIR